MAGMAYSKFHTNDTELLRLPPKSLYIPVENIIAGWASGKYKPAGCSADEFAEKIIDQIVEPGKSGMVFRGPWSSTINFLSKLAPQFVSVSFTLCLSLLVDADT